MLDVAWASIALMLLIAVTWFQNIIVIALLVRFYHFNNPYHVIDDSEKLDPVGSTVRYEMMKLCTGPV